MTARWLRRLLGLGPDTTAEARAHLARLDERDQQVQQLGRQLREARDRNHFSEMVGRAITRAQEGGTP